MFNPDEEIVNPANILSLAVRMKTARHFLCLVHRLKHFNFHSLRFTLDSSQLSIGSNMDDQYFSRCATWHRLNEQIVANDSRSPNAPRVITMDPWHEVVFMSADGEHTIAEFVKHIGSQYEGGTPPGLHEQVCGIVNELVAEGILRVHDVQMPLPPYFAEDYFQQPPEARKAQMEADGII